MTFQIPKKTHKTKLLGFKASPEEVKKLKQFCEKEKVTQSDVIRFAVRLIVPNF